MPARKPTAPVRRQRVSCAACSPPIACRCCFAIVTVRAWRRYIAVGAGSPRGIISAGIAAMQRPSSRLLAWLGPAIGPTVYEVGEDVRQALTTMSGALAAAFQPTRAGYWTLDLTGAARMLLEQQGVTDVYGGGACTYAEADRFFSHRRDGVTGRMATVIWLEAPSAPAYAELP